jgi:hypothetical protein
MLPKLFSGINVIKTFFVVSDGVAKYTTMFAHGEYFQAKVIFVSNTGANLTDVPQIFD